MTVPRASAVTVLALRIAYGGALVAAPARLTSRWLGPAAEDAGGRVAIRALGAREVLLHTGALAASLAGGTVTPWLAASIGGDLADIGATFADRDGLPDGSAAATAGVAGASALVSAVVAAALRRASD